MTSGQRSAQGPAFPDEALMAYHLVDRPRAHPGCQRLVLGRRNEGGLLPARFAGWRGVDAACWHRSIVQAGRQADSGCGAVSFADGPSWPGRG